MQFRLSAVQLGGGGGDAIGAEYSTVRGSMFGGRTVLGVRPLQIASGSAVFSCGA